FEHYLARECLRDLDHCREIKLFDRRFDRARRTRRTLVLRQPRMEPFELPNFSIRSPPVIAPSGLSQIKMCEFLETACSIKAGSHLAGDRLVLDEAISSCRHERALVQFHGFEWAGLGTGNLCGYQRCTIFEVLRAIRCPGLKLSPVPRERFSLLRVRGRSRRFAQCGARERGIEVVFSLLHRKERQERG